MKRILLLALIVSCSAYADDVIDCGADSAPMNEMQAHVQRTCEPSQLSKAVVDMNKVLEKSRNTAISKQDQMKLYDKIYDALMASAVKARDAFNERYKNVDYEKLAENLEKHVNVLNEILTADNDFKADRFQSIASRTPLIRMDPTPEHLRQGLVEKRYQETYAYLRQEMIKRDPNGLEVLFASKHLMNRIEEVHPNDFEETEGKPGEDRKMTYKKHKGYLRMVDAQLAVKDIQGTYASLINRLGKEKRTRYVADMGTLMMLYPDEVFGVLKANPELAPIFCLKVRQSADSTAIKNFVAEMFDGSNGLLAMLGMGTMFMPEKVVKGNAASIRGLLRLSAGFALLGATVEGASILKERENAARHFEALLTSADGQKRADMFAKHTGMKEDRQEIGATRMAVAIGIYALLRWDLNRTKTMLKAPAVSP